MKSALHVGAERVGLGIAVLLAASCARVDPGNEASGPAVDRPNLVLISIDSLRSDHLGCYGYERDTSPTLDRLAREGTLWEVATSSSSWTLPAHASLFTGLPESVHGVDRGERTLEPQTRTLAEALRAAGYRTAGVWSGPLLDPRFGFGQGFDQYLSHAAESNDWDEAVHRSHVEVTGPKTLAQVENLLPSLAEGPFFLFVHFWDVHYDYIPPPPYDSRFTDPGYSGPVTGHDLVDLVLHGRPDAMSPQDLEQLGALYDGEIAWVDHQVERLLEMLRSVDALHDSVIVVTSDHGEELFEHGHFGHKRQLFDESVRIPLIFWGPGYVAGGRRVAGSARIVDIAPTLLDLAGAEPLPSVMGRTLASRLTPGEEPPVPGPAEPALMELVVDPGADSSLLALRTLDWKIILQPDAAKTTGLWDLRQDPFEQDNLIDRDPALLSDAVAAVEVQLEQLKRLRALHPRREQLEQMPDDVRAQLESLGYLDPDRAAPSGLIWIEPDPLQVCDGTGLGVATVHWRVPDAERVKVHIGSAKGKLFADGLGQGQATTGKWVRDRLHFVLVSYGGEELGSVVARLTTLGCVRP